jgi:hypothetical protein
MIARAVPFLVGLTIGLGLLAGPAAEAASPNHITAWVPHFFGGWDHANGWVYVDETDKTMAPPGLSQKMIDLSVPGGCNPNSVVIRKPDRRPADLYVVCSSDWGGTNQILVYNTGTALEKNKTIDGLGTDNQPHFSGCGTNPCLLGSVFDKHGNLWVSKYQTNELLRISNAQLLTTTHPPRIDRVVIPRRALPAGLALDTDGSLWVVGQVGPPAHGGIALNFTDEAINQGNSFRVLDPKPRYASRMPRPYRAGAATT